MASKLAKRRFSRRPRVFWGVIGLLALVAVSYIGYRLSLYRQVQAEVAEIKEEGWPTNLEELDEWYSQPELETNAAPIYLEAFDRIVSPKKQTRSFVPIVGTAELPAPGEPFPDEMREAIRAYLEANEKALALLHRGAQVGQCRYPLSFSNGRPYLAHLSRIQASAELLRLEAAHHFSVGSVRLSIRALQSGLALANSLSVEPTLFSQRARTASLEVIGMGLKRVLNSDGLNQKSIGRLITALERLSQPAPLKQALLGECAMVLAGLDEMQFASNPKPREAFWLRLGVRVSRLTGELSRQKLRYLRSTKRLSNILERPITDWFDAILTLREEYGPFDIRPPVEPLEWLPTILRKPIMRIFPNLKTFDIPRVTESVIESGIGSIERMAVLRVRLLLCRTALAVESYRDANNGKKPQALDQLVPEYLDSVPIDPYSGDPLRFETSGHRYLIYSVGQNRVDDGGQEDPRGTGPDIAFAVHR